VRKEERFSTRRGKKGGCWGLFSYDKMPSRKFRARKAIDDKSGEERDVISVSAEEGGNEDLKSRQNCLQTTDKDGS